jgi:hypothetical protein
MPKSYLDLIAYVQRAIEEAGGVPLDLAGHHGDKVAHDHDDDRDPDHGDAGDLLQLRIETKLVDEVEQHQHDDDQKQQEHEVLA